MHKKEVFILLFFLSLSFVSADPLLDSATPGDWTELPNTDLDSASNILFCDDWPNGKCTVKVGGFGGIMGAWNGGVYDSIGNGLIVAGGGHGNYIGGEGYRFNFDTLTWEQLSPPPISVVENGQTNCDGVFLFASICGFFANTPNALTIVPESDRNFHASSNCYGSVQEDKCNVYADLMDKENYLAGSHTYKLLTFIPTLGSQGSYCHMGLAATLGNNAGTARVLVCFDMATRTYTHYDDLDAASIVESWSTYDPFSDRIFWGPKDFFIKAWDPDTNTLTQFDGLSWKGQGTATVNTDTRELVLYGGDITYPIITYDIDDTSGQATRNAVTLTGDPITPPNSQWSPGFEYDPIGKVFYLYYGNNELYTIDPNVADGQPWIVTDLNPGGPAPTTEASGGVYGRFRYLSAEDGFGYVDATGKNVFFYKPQRGPVCIPGQTQSCGPATDVGACSFGTTTCGSDSQWQSCSGAVYPTTEILNSLDDDCDGQIDEDFCTPGTSRQCGTSDIGACSFGTETCNAQGGWDVCVGAITPIVEIDANNIDDDCDGQIDEVIPSGSGLLGEYYASNDLSGTPQTRIDQTIDFDWGTSNPGLGLPNDQFSVRWSGFVTSDYSEDYTFITTTDDGVRLWINNQLIIDFWQPQSSTERSGTITLQSGTSYPIIMEYYEGAVDAVAKLSWQSNTLAREIIPATHFSTDSQRPTCTPTTEICNGQDDDCDGQIDEGLSCEGPTFNPNPSTCPGDFNEDGVKNMQDMYLLAANWANLGSTDKLARAWDILTNFASLRVGKSCATVDAPSCAGCNLLNCDINKCALAQTANGGRCNYDSQRPKSSRCYDAGPQCSPTTEICDGSDNDCDGQVDEEGVCAPTTCTHGQTQSCGTDVGACVAGTQTCSNDAWGSCEGAVGPTTEICDDGLDNDCDGFTDSADTDCGAVFVGGYPMPDLQDEKDTYTSAGWIWDPLAEPTYPSVEGCYVNYPDIHGDVEGDDLWSYLMMYLRTGEEGYYDRAEAWVDYYKNRHYDCTGGSSYCFDRDSHGGDHLFGWGLLAWYEYTGDTEALAVAEQIGADMEVRWGDKVPGETPMVFNSIRGGARHLHMATRLAEVTGDQRWIDLRDLLVDLWLQSPGWNEEKGVYFVTSSGTTDSVIGISGEYEAGAQILPIWHVTMLSDAMFHAQRTITDPITKTALQQRIIDMAYYIDQYGMGPTGEHLGSWIGTYADGTFFNRGDGGGGAYTLSVTGALVHGYKFTCDTQLLDRAKAMYLKGTRADVEDDTRYASNEFPHFVDTRFRSASLGKMCDNEPTVQSKTWNYGRGNYLHPNKGVLQHTWPLFENGGQPSCTSSF